MTRKRKAPYDPDIVLIKLKKRFDTHKFLHPACLPTKEVHDGASCLVSGWGKRGGSITSKELYGAHLKKVYSYSDGTIGMYSQTNSPCAGDSGGPLICPTSGGATLHGIVNGGYKYCTVDGPYYNIFTNVFKFMDQIRDIIKKGSNYFWVDDCPSTYIHRQR